MNAQHTELEADKLQQKTTLTDLRFVSEAIMWPKVCEKYFQYFAQYMAQWIKTGLKAKQSATWYKQGVRNEGASECIFISHPPKTLCSKVINLNSFLIVQYHI